MARVLYNCVALLADGNDYSLKKCSIVSENGYIVGVFDNVPDDNYSRVINLSKEIIIPPFFNMHCHLGENMFQRLNGNNWSINKYLEYTSKYNESLSLEEQETVWHESAVATLKNLEVNGIIGICAGRSAEVAEIFDFNNMSGYPIMNGRKLEKFKDAGVKGFREYLQRYRSRKCSVGVLLHSLYENDRESIKLARACLEVGAEFFSVHVAEDENTALQEKNFFGESAVTILDKFGLLTDRTILVHCGFVSLRDWEKIAKSGASVAVCPISNKFLNTRMPNLHLLDTYGIPWFLTTDGLGTGKTFSLFEQAKCLKENFPDISYSKIFRSFTALPAALFNRDHYSGNISVGTKAEFLALPLHSLDEKNFFRLLFDKSNNLSKIIL